MSKKLIKKLIGPLEKGIKAMKIHKPSEGVYEGTDLKELPSYICYKSALLREKLTLKYIIVMLILILSIVFISDRFEISSLYKKLREKEYILAPGVIDFTPAAPQSVSDSYVKSAVIDFLGQLGNVNPVNIEEQYRSLSSQMKPDLKVRFLAETSDWVKKVKAENITETLTVNEKQIETDEHGSYKVVAIVRRDTYINNEHIGFQKEVIEINMNLVPPKREKKWYLQINSLFRTDFETYKSKIELENQ